MNKYTMKHLGFIIFIILLSFQLKAQFTNPAKFDFTSGEILSLSQYTGNSYPSYFCIGQETNTTDGTFNTNLKTDTQYSNANNPGRWKDEGVKTFSYRGGSDELQRGCFQFRANATDRINIQVSWTVRVISYNTNINYIELQWKDGSDIAGTWNDVDNDLFELGVTTDPMKYALTLPAAANGLSDLRIRWIYYEIGTGSRARLAVDDITISTQPKPLPVELSLFNAIKQNNQALLQWQTKSELNFNSFIIEKSYDGERFDQITSLKANGGVNTASEYKYLDPDNLAKIQYYRLKLLDNDGSYSYSNIVSIAGALKEEISIFPNPVRDNINIYFPKDVLGQLTEEIFDISGKIVYKNIIEVTDSGIQSVNLPRFLPGLYTLRITSPAYSKTIKFVKHF